MTKKVKSLPRPHRGRIQAQGGGIEESERWAQDEPLTLVEGLTLESNVRRKLTPAERAARQAAFKEARDFMARAHANGGVPSVVMQTYPVVGDLDRRVDLEVRKGLAFV